MTKHIQAYFRTEDEAEGEEPHFRRSVQSIWK